MKAKKTAKLFFSCIGTVALVIADQLTKYLTIVHLKNTSGISLIPGVFELQYVENRGAAFGILQQKRIFLILISILVLIALLYLYTKIPDQKRYLPLKILAVMILSGAVGNMIDRIFRGYVVDFFYFRLIDFPVFNVADCYVVISVIAAFFFVCFYYTDEDLSFFKFKK